MGGEDEVEGMRRVTATGGEVGGGAGDEICGGGWWVKFQRAKNIQIGRK
jgi:hypothetical protein